MLPLHLSWPGQAENQHRDLMNRSDHRVSIVETNMLPIIASPSSINRRDWTSSNKTSYVLTALATTNSLNANHVIVVATTVSVIIPAYATVLRRQTVPLPLHLPMSQQLPTLPQRKQLHRAILIPKQYPLQPPSQLSHPTILQQPRMQGVYLKLQLPQSHPWIQKLKPTFYLMRASSLRNWQMLYHYSHTTRRTHTYPLLPLNTPSPRRWKLLTFISKPRMVISYHFLCSSCQPLQPLYGALHR